MTLDPAYRELVYNIFLMNSYFMRLWSIHSKYLDTEGLVALWREGILAKRVLEGCCKGYVNNPQLLRFRLHDKPATLINAYLYSVFLEAKRRGYNFNHPKIEPIPIYGAVAVMSGQLEYEFYHLLEKLKKCDEEKFKELINLELTDIEPNPVSRLSKAALKSGGG